MAYYTRTEAIWAPSQHTRAPVKCGPQLVAHDECLPEDQFETRQHSAGAYRHQKRPWCWSHVYGGQHKCWYCGGTVA